MGPNLKPEPTFLIFFSAVWASDVGQPAVGPGLQSDRVQQVLGEAGGEEILVRRLRVSLLHRRMPVRRLRHAGHDWTHQGRSSDGRQVGLSWSDLAYRLLAFDVKHPFILRSTPCQRIKTLCWGSCQCFKVVAHCPMISQTQPLFRACCWIL